MTIAITGATGQLGRLVVQELLRTVPAGELVALVRTPAKAADLGIAARPADYTRPETLPAALAGVDTLLLISGNEVGQRIAQHRNVVDAAQRAGVRRIVYTSLLHADTSPLSLAPEHLETENAIKASGLAYTLLRNGWYIENHTGAIAPALATGVLAGASGEGKFSAAARGDYALAAATVLTGSGHEGKTYELAGDDPYTRAQFAAEVARQAGKPVVYRNMTEAEYAQALAGVGLPAPIAQAVASWDALAADGALYDDSGVLAKLIGRPTTPLSKVIAQALA
ncbi:NAD(P)-dependent oxidoreductase [Bordetella genomosp. 9]|uniref:NAD(P)-dependent oxidoreductase n=1 Tax=Bordetella genomosp. 9 TaxID=1416803 RepID=A0A261R804_9BORD|nr:SDR family oxidoreductase [Bordetella genomosp. 9]OZI21091.1 NAD(P)-dependent oxidoreductase [Bordetella genomosp. 9]